MKSGKTAMTIHHLGSSKTMEAALGDKISAAPVPKGTEGYWTSFGDEENGVFSASKYKDAAFALLTAADLTSEIEDKQFLTNAAVDSILLDSISELEKRNIENSMESDLNDIKSVLGDMRSCYGRTYYPVVQSEIS